MESKRYDQEGKNLKEKKCYNCFTKETPLWRRSKKGNNLCNACGLYFRNHGEHRPISNTINNQNHMSSDNLKKNIIFLEKLAVDALAEMRSKVKAEQLKNKEKSEKHYKDGDYYKYNEKLSDMKLQPSYHFNKRPFVENKPENVSKSYRRAPSDLGFNLNSKPEGPPNFNNQVKARPSELMNTSYFSNCQILDNDAGIQFQGKTVPQYGDLGIKKDFQLTMKKGRPSLSDYMLKDEYNSEDMQDIVNRLVSFTKK